MSRPANSKYGPQSADYTVKGVYLLPAWVLWTLAHCRDILILGVLGMVVYFMVTHFLFESLQIQGPSMSPTLQNNGYFWLNRLSYVRGEPQQADIVALKDPQDGALVVKRIIATPGQSVYLYRGKVYVDGKLLNEPYLPDKTPTYAYERNENELFVVGRNEYFVMGDNRNNSTDSRSFGPVPRRNILGKVVE